MNGSIELTSADLRAPDQVGPASAASPSSPSSLSPQLARTTSMPGLDLRTRSSVIETELPNFFTVFWLFAVRALVEHTRFPSEFLYEMILQVHHPTGNHSYATSPLSPLPPPLPSTPLPSTPVHSFPLMRLPQLLLCFDCASSQLLSGTVVGAIYRNFAFQQMPTMNFMMALSVG